MVAAAYTPLLDDAEKLSVADLRALQLDRLKWSIGHAFDKCAPYRALCESAGVGPADLTALEDLAKFPMTGKAELRAAYPFGFFACDMDQVARIHAS
ncbi:MAG: phenylacetate--CoA ligase, partial [Pseudomonadota bacterium]|nr:phenylacetate--CoA ligase [Pseudomonadota bacterium]MEC8180786.1 phenylacetate--CoA ligase [Pseudomonadota bacterium]